MTQEELKATEFPLGEYTKVDIRKIAEKNEFINANKPDSQDICFVPDGDYAGAIKRFTGKEYEPGDFVDAKGNTLGRHKGIIAYTIGQRKGLGISAESPLYVKEIDTKTNSVVLAYDEDLYETECIVKDINWTAPWLIDEEMRLAVKIRYRQKEQAATLKMIDSSKGRIIFDEQQRAITPGQSAVFYSGDVVLGGGIIEVADCCN